MDYVILELSFLLGVCYITRTFLLGKKRVRTGEGGRLGHVAPYIVLNRYAGYYRRKVLVVAEKICRPA
jgi:hypothetical protein